MAKTTENMDPKIDENHDCDNEKAVESNVTLYPRLETTVVSPSKPNVQQQPHTHQQTTVNHHRNGHSRNPSSINGITIVGQTIQPPLNKPDAIHSLLKLIRFRSDDCDEKSKNQQICGIREARLIKTSGHKEFRYETIQQYFVSNDERHQYDYDTVVRTFNRSTASSSSWLRSIPRRIRKLISKSTKHLERAKTETTNNSERIGSTGSNGIADSNFYSLDDDDEEIAMKCARSQMAKHGWFWGPKSRQTAQQRLHGKPNGSFLVRNSQLNSHNFTISFRTSGNTFHYRIEFNDGYWQTFSSKHRSIVDLIEDAMKKSKESVFCYVKQSSQLIPPFPVRLTNPISHFGDISSLQSMCRTVIQKNVNTDQMDLLPLPNKLISYCREGEQIYS